MTCENVTIKGDKGTPITAYVARPSGPGPFPGVVLVHHLPGWSEFYIETTRRFAHHGHLAICANLYEREGGGSDGNPDDVAAKVRAEGGIADSQMVGDTEAAVKWMRAKSITTARLVFSAPARAAGTPSSMPASGRTSMLAPSCGEAAW
jgi:carboxymethylenebutenolidase